jgi:hypothetical protein
MAQMIQSGQVSIDCLGGSRCHDPVRRNEAIRMGTREPIRL